jgi:RNA polymerase sigma-70 factor, ECF subfamily
MKLLKKYTTSPMTDPSLSQSEKESYLATGAAQGDREAQRLLVNEVFDTVTATVSYALNSSVFAQDVVQESLVEVLKSMKYFRGECSLATWSRRISMRVAYRKIRMNRKYQQRLRSFTQDTYEEARGEHDLISRELQNEINSAISLLPIKQQQVIRLKYIHEHSISEIAQIVEAPQETVRDRLKVGKRKLKRILTKNPDLKDWIEKGA